MGTITWITWLAFFGIIGGVAVSALGWVRFNPLISGLGGAVALFVVSLFVNLFATVPCLAKWEKWWHLFVSLNFC